jgi:hypothetical protein
MLVVLMEAMAVALAVRGPWEVTAFLVVIHEVTSSPVPQPDLSFPPKRKKNKQPANLTWTL